MSFSSKDRLSGAMSLSLRKALQRHICSLALVDLAYRLAGNRQSLHKQIEALLVALGEDCETGIKSTQVAAAGYLPDSLYAIDRSGYHQSNDILRRAETRTVLALEHTRRLALREGRPDIADILARLRDAAATRFSCLCTSGTSVDQPRASLLPGRDAHREDSDNVSTHSLMSRLLCPAEAS